jgi:hypothetical protein
LELQKKIELETLAGTQSIKIETSEV